MLPEKNQDIKILTVQEVADILRVHRSTVSRFAQSGFAQSGELKSYRVGNRRLFKIDDVWAFFENQVAGNMPLERRFDHGNRCDR
jgi:excisionase family DNA binding protein